MAYNPNQIANYFLFKFGERRSITPMKLIKLVYIAHGWHLGISEDALIGENPEAWRYGPVIPSIYHKFKSFGNNIITGENVEEPNLPIDIKKFLDRIWEVYGGNSAISLSSLTHQINTPWYIVWNSVLNAEFLSLQIPEELIREHYRGILLQNMHDKTH